MAKKYEIKNKKKNNRNKILSKSKKNIAKKKELNFTDIQLKIINYIKNNKSDLNYYYSDIRKIKKNKEIIEKVKNSCLCWVSDEFGTAVCINEKGYILTCAHAAPPFEDEKTKESIYIFPNGELVKTLTIIKDEKLDLAMLKIIEIFNNKKFIKINNSNIKFEFANIKKFWWKWKNWGKCFLYW